MPQPRESVFPNRDEDSEHSSAPKTDRAISSCAAPRRLSVHPPPSQLTSPRSSSWTTWPSAHLSTRITHQSHLLLDALAGHQLFPFLSSSMAQSVALRTTPHPGIVAMCAHTPAQRDPRTSHPGSHKPCTVLYIAHSMRGEYET